ncbi:hypothetical protein BDW62DRAFT_57027 [Aspergillus aurantiobrunneus]
MVRASRSLTLPLLEQDALRGVQQPKRKTECSAVFTDGEIGIQNWSGQPCYSTAVINNYKMALSMAKAVSEIGVHGHPDSCSPGRGQGACGLKTGLSACWPTATGASII